jgi:hypothetical protein
MENVFRLFAAAFGWKEQPLVEQQTRQNTAEYENYKVSLPFWRQEYYRL